MKLKGDFFVSREINSVRSNEGLSSEVITADKALTRYDSAWVTLDASTANQIVELPDATTLPNGWKVVVHNVGAANNLSVADYDGAFGGTVLKVIKAVPDAQEFKAYQFTLIDGTTAAGVWYVMELADITSVVATKFVANFLIADWPTASGGKRELTSTQIAGLGAATHGRGVNPVYIVQELVAANTWDRLLLDREQMDASGNLKLRIITNDTFDGRVIFV